MWHQARCIIRFAMQHYPSHHTLDPSSTMSSAVKIYCGAEHAVSAKCCKAIALEVPPTMCICSLADVVVCSIIDNKVAVRDNIQPATPFDSTADCPDSSVRCNGLADCPINELDNPWDINISHLLLRKILFSSSRDRSEHSRNQSTSHNFHTAPPNFNHGCRSAHNSAASDTDGRLNCWLRTHWSYVYSKACRCWYQSPNG